MQEPFYIYLMIGCAAFLGGYDSSKPHECVWV